eukprot:3584612-Lingulodinium_polyedra.AAC.1
MRTPVCGVCMVCATRAISEPLRRQTVDSTASLCTVFKLCTMTRSNRPSTAAAPRKSCASRAPCKHQFG